ncbi:MAG: NADH-quinone oxidoreductase subunit N, partial [Gemmatimonadaceae bacterium]
LRLFDSPLLLVGIAMLTVGFSFKVAAAPFHMWAPDVYEGAPTPVTAYMAAAVKAAAFAAFLRVWVEAFPSRETVTAWHPAIWWLAAATMVVGNFIALAQRNVKRLLAYSSIAHAGYVLVAVVVGSPAATSSFLFYLLAYTIATMGAFAVVIALGSAGEPNLMVDDYSGLWTVRPGYAVAMAIFMLALLGFPFFGGLGFFAKWYVLQAALQGAAPQTRLAVLLVLTSVVSAGYYLYVVMVMFMRPRAAAAAALAPVSWWTKSVIVAAALVTVLGGLYPSPLVNWARRGVPALPVGVPSVPAAPGAPGAPGVRPATTAVAPATPTPAAVVAASR